MKRYLLLGNWKEIAGELCTGSLEGSNKMSTDQSPDSLLTVGAAAAEHAERRLVQRVLEETKGNRKKAAQRLNISYKGLLNKLKRWGGDQPRVSASQTNSASGF